MSYLFSAIQWSTLYIFSINCHALQAVGCKVFESINSLTHLIWTRIWCLMMKTSCHETDALIMIFIVMNALSYIIKTFMIIIMRIFFNKACVKHLWTCFSVFSFKTFVDLTGTWTFFIKIFMIFIIDTACKLFEAEIKVVIVVGEALRRLICTCWCVMLLTRINVSEACVHVRNLFKTVLAIETLINLVAACFK